MNKLKWNINDNNNKLIFLDINRNNIFDNKLNNYNNIFKISVRYPHSEFDALYRYYTLWLYRS